MRQKILGFALSALPLARYFLRVFILALCYLLLALCSSAQAQQPKKFYRIGYLVITDAVRESARATAIRVALHEMGYIEGQNIAFEYRYAEEKRERYSRTCGRAGEA